MPPATPHMDKLQAGTAAELTSPLPLHAVVWAPRADNKKVFNPWLKDALVKQGMYTQVRYVSHNTKRLISDPALIEATLLNMGAGWLAFAFASFAFASLARSN